MGRGERHDGPHQRCFTGPISTHHGDRLPFCEREIDSVKDVTGTVIGVDPSQLEHASQTSQVNALDFFVTLDFFGGTLGDLLAVMDDENALGDLHNQFDVMFDDDDGDTF